jgi:hypothetical protein
LQRHRVGDDVGVSGLLCPIGSEGVSVGAVEVVGEGDSPSSSGTAESFAAVGVKLREREGGEKKTEEKDNEAHGRVVLGLGVDLVTDGGPGLRGGAVREGGMTADANVPCSGGEVDGGSGSVVEADVYDSGGGDVGGGGDAG